MSDPLLDLIASDKAPAAPAIVQPSAPLDPEGDVKSGVSGGVYRVDFGGTSADAFKTTQTAKPEDFKGSDPLAALVASDKGAAPAPVEAAAPAPAPEVSPSLIGRALDVIDPMSAALGVDRGQALKGIASGFADLGNTLIGRMRESVPAAMQTATEPADTERRASLRDFNKANAGGSFDLGRLAGNIGATLPLAQGLTGAVPAALGLTASPLGPTLPGLVPRAIEAVRSVPYLGRVAGPAVAALPAMGDAALNAGIQTAATNPAQGWTGAAIGAVTPPLVGAAVRGGGAVANLVRSMAQGNASRDAASVLRAAGMAEADIPAAIAKLRANNGLDALGLPMASHQVLYDPVRPETAGMSQLYRNLIDQGNTALFGVRNAQNTGRLAALDAISPVAGTTQQAAEAFGAQAVPEILAGDAAARKATRNAFEAIDPFNQGTRFELPLSELEAQRARYLGPGTFGIGGAARDAVRTAQEVGTETLEAVKQASNKLTQDESTLAQFVRRAGGINAGNESGRAFGGELESLRQSSTGLVNKGRGQDIDKLAERLHEAGYLPDSDPATLIERLHTGSTMTGLDADMAVLHQRAMEAAQMGEAPGAQTITKPVPWQVVQNLRSSMAAAARKIESSGAGANKESAALREMIGELDKRVNLVAEGKGNPSEFFPQDMVDQYRRALQLKRDQIATYRTGQQNSIFRMGADNQAAVDGAQLAPKFFNSGLNQARAIRDFSRIESPATRNLLRNYAITDLVQTARNGGDVLTPAAVNKWLKVRTGATAGLFTDAEQQTLANLAKTMKANEIADTANVARGSATAQNAATAQANGLLDSKLLDWAAHKVPVIGTGLLEGLRAATSRGKTARLGELMSDPQALADAMERYGAFSARQAAPMLGAETLAPGLLRLSPALVAGSAR